MEHFFPGQRRQDMNPKPCVLTLACQPELAPHQNPSYPACTLPAPSLLLAVCMHFVHACLHV